MIILTMPGAALLWLVLWLIPIWICLQKGKIVLALIGLFFPALWFPFTVIGAMRLAKPDSHWAAKHYAPDGPLMQAAIARYPNRATAAARPS